jgi:hypothetical protein
MTLRRADARRSAARAAAKLTTREQLRKAADAAVKEFREKGGEISFVPFGWAVGAAPVQNLDSDDFPENT